MVVPSNISDPRDLEIARLRAEVEAERFKRAGAESAYELLSIQSASVVRELERTESALSAARAALDGEREATRSVRIDIADIVRVVAEMPRAKADESIVRWTERLQAVTISSARRAANEKEKSS